jgi:hypothetical protein
MVITPILFSLVLMIADTGDFVDEPGASEWFKGNVQRLCCQIADGHRVEVRRALDGYEANINGKWERVPKDAIVRGLTSPFGMPVVWYVLKCGLSHDKPCIMCVVLNPGEMAAKWRRSMQFHIAHQDTK